MSELRNIFVGYYRPHSKDGVIVCLIVDTQGRVLSRGISICSPSDQGHKRYGQQKAKARAERILKKLLRHSNFNPTWATSSTLPIRRTEAIAVLHQLGLARKMSSESDFILPDKEFRFKAEYNPTNIPEREKKAIERMIRYEGLKEDKCEIDCKCAITDVCRCELEQVY